MRLLLPFPRQLLDASAFARQSLSYRTHTSKVKGAGARRRTARTSHTLPLIDDQMDRFLEAFSTASKEHGLIS
jgi:hypothetical protein